MQDDRVTLKDVSWRDIFPPLLIFRSLPTALSLTVLVLALIGVVLTPIGWIVSENLFVGDELKQEVGFEHITEMNRSPYKAVFPKWQAGQSVLTVLGNQLRGVELVFVAYARPLIEAVSLHHGLGRFLYFFVGGIWTLLVWAFFGCAITRAALMRYTRLEPIGIDDAIDYAINKFISCFSGVCLPLIGVAVMVVPMAILGLLMATNIGAALGGALWVLVLFGSLLITVILFVVAVAWPLVISAISCEGQDSFDGMSRAFAYVLQRPIHFVAYALIAIIFSGVCWLVISSVIDRSVETAFWATSWGSNVGGNRTIDLAGNVVAADMGLQTPDDEAESGQNAENTSTMLWLGQRGIQFWSGVARTFGSAFLYGMFWSIAAAVYLLLRKDLDDTEMDEIYLVDEKRTFELPPLRTDEDGVPQIDKDTEAPGTDASPSEADSADKPGEDPEGS